MGRPLGSLFANVQSESGRCADERRPGNAFRSYRVGSHDFWLGQLTKFLSRLDALELVNFRQHVVCSERPAIHVDAFSVIHFDGLGSEAKLVVERIAYRMVVAVPRSFYYPVCVRCLGVLTIYGIISFALLGL